jgi:HK97 family phage major capsid protein
MVNLLGNADVRMIRPTWFMAPRTRNFFSFLRNSQGFLVYPSMVEMNPTLLGFPVKYSNNIPINLGTGGGDSEIYLVDMADVLLGESTQLILEVSAEAAYSDGNGTLQSAFSRDETVVRAIQRHDLVMRHDASVAVLTTAYYD